MKKYFNGGSSKVTVSNHLKTFKDVSTADSITDRSSGDLDTWKEHV